MHTSCKPESLTNEDKTEILVVNPTNEETHEGTGFSYPDKEPNSDNRG
ncbi:hypothetical protein C8N46_103176 [Kordia periserrulae]|uniref:Uncharacterized protein n=1 Tax=Kordia periserrulae TaxID=701523 RepID=A0A2T6C181_9FLAO|nr:hypothetical protein C8N46_103176 [Kordia periserrulae]